MFRARRQPSGYTGKAYRRNCASWGFGGRGGNQLREVDRDRWRLMGGGIARHGGVGGFVLAGGGSTRFGRDKALVQIADEVLLARLCLVIRGVTPSVTIIGSPEKYSRFGVECVADHWPGEGPLGGV